MLERTLVLLALLAVYTAAGKVGLSLAQIHPSASAVWPPTGIAIAACLLLGYRVWPIIFAGAFVVNITTAGTFWTSSAIAVGNTLEAVAGAYLVNRLGEGPRSFLTPRGTLRFALFAGAVATAISATFGVTSLSLAGFSPWESFTAVWLTWWLGDMSGALIVTPLILLFADRDPPERRQSLTEFALLLGVLVVSAQAAFAAWHPFPSRNYPLEFLPIPGLIWAAFRFTPRETATAVFVLAALALLGTLQGTGPFARGDQHESLLLLQAFLATMSVMGLVLAGAVQTRRWAEESAKAAEERLQLLSQRAKVEAALAEAQAIAHVGSWEWDIPGDRVTWSDELYRIYGLQPGELDPTYQGFLLRVDPEDRERVDVTVRDAYTHGKAFNFVHRIDRPDGSVRVLRARGEVIRDSAGAPLRMVGTAQDITEVRRAEEEREQLILERAARAQAEQRALLLQEVGRLKEEFVAAATHQLKTPLTSIRAYAQLLQRALNAEPVDVEHLRDGMVTIEREATTLGTSLAHLLDLSRVETEGLQLHPALLELRSEVGAAIEQMGPGDGTRVSIAPGPSEVLGMWDPGRLREVLTNLLTNALKYSRGRVVVTVEEQDDLAHVSVADEGIGVAPEDLPHLFERHYRAPAARRAGAEGEGLGLHICRQIVSAHGGRIWAESEGEEKGACFHFTLPRGYRSSSPEGEVGPSSLPTVLVVEDEGAISRLLSILLEDAGYRVRVASNGDEAYAVAQSLRPGLILSDVKLAGMDGVQLVDRLRQTPEFASTPVILMSAYGEPKGHRADRFLAKPFDIDEVLAAVEAHLPIGRRPEG